MKHRLQQAATLLILLLVPSVLFADAQQDLADGRDALARGEMQEARSLLESAARDLPQSVEAQMALGECYLKLGELDLALAQYQATLRLSPEHAQAKQLVETLTGRSVSFEEKLAAVGALMNAGAFSEAAALLRPLVNSGLDVSQRNAARLLRLEALLWSGGKEAAFAAAIELAQQTDDASISGPARVIAALDMIYRSKANVQKSRAAAEVIAAAGELQEPWATRARLIDLFEKLGDPGQAVEASTEVAGTLSSIPSGTFQTWVRQHAANRVLAIARTELGRGDHQKVLALVWPMISNRDLPGIDQIGAAIEVSEGWLEVAMTAPELRVHVSRLLMDVGRQEFERDGAKATLLGYWLAAENNRQMDDPEAVVQQQLNLSVELARCSLAAPARLPGELLSTADDLQNRVLRALAAQTVNAKQRQMLVQQIGEQIERYRAAGDLETGLAQFVTAERDQGNDSSVSASLASGLDQLIAGASQRDLLLSLAGSYIQVGQEAFDKAAATLSATANQSLHEADQIALSLLRHCLISYPQEARTQGLVDALVQRFSANNHWSAAFQALAVYESTEPVGPALWAAAQLKIRRAIAGEDRLLSTNRKLGEELSAEIVEAIGEITSTLQTDRRDGTRHSAIGILESLINRYAALQRLDLSEKVVDRASGQDASHPLADWSLWSRINLLERKAAVALSVARERDGDEEVALHELHQSELALIDQLLATHAESTYRGSCVDRVLQISGVYQQLGSYSVATEVLEAFTTNNPNITSVERIEYQVVQIAVNRAQRAFADRQPGQGAPTELLAEHTAAIAALTRFLQARPVGDAAINAEGELFQIVRVYGEAGAWSVSREVLQQFADALPDFRSPEHLTLLRAVTYLGELDRQYGLSLLTMTAASAAGGDYGSGPVDAIAGFEAYGDFAREGAAREESELPSGGAGGGVGNFHYNLGVTADAMASSPDPSPTSGLDPGLRIAGRASETALAMIRQSQQRQFQQIAMLEADDRAQQAKSQQLDQPFAQQGQAIALQSGSVLSEAEMERQDEAAEAAYAILIDIIRQEPPAQSLISRQARQQILWLFGFYEGQSRADRAIAMIDRYLTDQPLDSAKVALAFQAINDRLAWAVQRRADDRPTLNWLDEKHVLFDEARKSIEGFVADFADEQEWVHRAQLLTADSYQSEAEMAVAVSAVRAGGLLVRSSEVLTELLHAAPSHPQRDQFAQRMWNVAERLRELGQLDGAIFVLSQIPIQFPTHSLVQPSVWRIAELHATNLSDPLKAVETYQEFVSVSGDTEQVRSQIFDIAAQLGAKQRYIESLHVYEVFVDSFPTDPRAPAALQAIGQTHQSNEAWDEAIRTYRRILEEYTGAPIVPNVQLAVAQCQINLSQWREARKLYEEFVQQFPEDGQIAMVQERLALLKSLDRYQTLLADAEVERHKDDAQYEIARMVLTQLSNPVKAVREFGKVVETYPNSDLADDAQLEIGKALLALQRMDEAREALLNLPAMFPNSPLADDALFLVAQSYEQAAARLASVTLAGARARAIQEQQRGAYRQFNENVGKRMVLQAQRRDELKKAGKSAELALDEAAQSFLNNSFAISGLSNTSRQAELQAETESALQVANRRDRINDANREAVKLYVRAATEYPLGDRTDDSLLRIAHIFETELKDRAAAMETYQKIVKQFPGTPVAEDAAWNVAIFYEREGKFTQAATAFREFIRNYPASARVADAQYSLAEVLEELGQWVEAMDEYETFRQKFAEHPKAIIAREQINWIRTYRK